MRAKAAASCLSALFLLSLGALPAFSSTDSVRGILQPDSYLCVDGDSTMHKWSSTTTVIEMFLDVSSETSKDLAEALRNNQIKAIDIKIPVSELKSGESKLDKNLQNAMDSDKFPEVAYHASDYGILKSTYCSIVASKVSGELTIRGQTNPATMDVEFSFEPDGVKILGSYTLKMSDYGIKPPTMMLGMIKVRDPVTIRFYLFLKS